MKSTFVQISRRCRGTANIGTVLLCREPAETTGCSQSPASYLKETLTFAR